MEKIIWNEIYSVHVRALDEQHQKLIKLINTFIQLSKVSVNSEEISDALTEMTEYAHYHFNEEEQYLLKYNYSGYQSHRKEHREFKRKVADLCVDVIQNKATIPLEIHKFLFDWCTNHIFKSDMEFGRFFKGKNIQ